jgi:diguanylate cyclase (GGDEF)-like protein/PAS domain S-box-containing protein
MPQFRAELEDKPSERVKGNPRVKEMSGQAAKAPWDREAHLQGLLSSLDDLVFELDENGTYVEIWGTNDALLFAPRSELLGRTHTEAISEEVGLRLKQIIASVGETGRPEIWEYCLEVPAGTRWFRGRIAPIAGSEGSSRRFCLLVRDITAQKEAEQEITRLLSREQLLSRLSEVVPVGLFEIDLSGHVTFSNDRIHTITGDLSANTLEALMSSVVVAEDRPALESAVATVLADQSVDDLEIRFCLQAPDDQRDAGVVRVCQLSLRALTDAAGTVTGAVGCISDVTDPVQLRQELEVRASVDKLTSCLNREASLELVEAMTAAPKAPTEGNALIYVDLDDFKSVNDRLGHAAGDSLLVAAADRLRGAARRGDAVGRLGGDEFLVICPRVESPAQAVRIAERVAAATEATIDVGTGAVELRTSVGVAWTTKAIDADAFLAQADSAMYESKRTRRNGVTLFATDSRDASPLVPGALRVGTPRGSADKTNAHSSVTRGAVSRDVADEAKTENWGGA